MKFSSTTLALAATAAVSLPSMTSAQSNMVKMCLFYDSPSGHARSDPIINQECTSSHVHTFYGPRSFHPSTTYEDLLSTPGSMNTSPYVENKSLYWHPTIYQVSGDGTHTRVDNLEFGPYYRWDRQTVAPAVEPFPPQFRMIAASNDPGACGVGEDCPEENFIAMFTECCNFTGNDGESCSSWEGELFFPNQNCDFVGIALAMPTCWDGRTDSPDHKSHMAYTTNGQLNGSCPSTHQRRLPQVQVFIRIPNYRGSEFTYVLADGNTIPGSSNSWNFHTDFFNGWDEGKFEEIMDNCAPHPDREPGDYNPPCDCTPGEESLYDGGLTVNENVPPQVCDADVKRLIVDEEIAVTSEIPSYSGSCQGAPMIPRTWTDLTPDLFSTDCNNPITNGPTPQPSPVSTSNPTKQPTSPPSNSVTPPPSPLPTSNPTKQPTSTSPPPSNSPTPPPSPLPTNNPTEQPTPPPSNSVTPPPSPLPTSNPTKQPISPPGEVYKAIVCGRGYGCDEGDWEDAEVNEIHEVRCCRDCSVGGCPRAWKQKCPDEDPDVFSRSKIKGQCKQETFEGAINQCKRVGGRLCTPWEIEDGCAAGTGCGYDKEMIWACMYDGHECEESSECCGECVDGECQGGDELFE